MQATGKLDFNTDSFGSAQVAAMEAFNKFDKAKTQEHYDKVSTNYEAIYLRAGYPDPEKCADYVDLYTQTQDLGKGDVEILDLGCGTGLVGKHLADRGFSNVTGIDVSEKMLEQAAEKNAYKQLEQLELGQEEFLDTFPHEHRKKYDFVTAAGLVVNNYLDEKIFEQMLLSLRNGGIMVFSARFSYLGQYWYVDKLEELEKLGRVKALDSEEFFKYANMP